MDNRLNALCIKEAVTAWIAGRRDELGSIILRYSQTSESSVILEANGRLLQIVIPSSFQMEGLSFAAPKSSEEVFLVTSLDSQSDEIFESVLTILNEKLERIKIEPDALCQVLDQLLIALRKFEAKKDQKMKTGNGDVKRDISRRRSPATGNIGVRDDESDDDNDLPGEESDPGIGSESEQEESPDHYGYDLAASEDVNKALDSQFKSNGFLFAMAEDARLQCEMAQEDVRGMDVDSTSVDGLLRWCDVFADPKLLNVNLLMQIGGVVWDDGAAASLGFSLDSPVKLSLQFNRRLWSQVDYDPSSYPLKLEKRRVTQETDFSKKDPVDESDEDTQKIRKFDQTHLYGIEVLLPGLVDMYFDFLVNKTEKSESLDILDELEQFSTMDNPFVGLLYFLGARIRALPDWCVVCWNSLPYSVCQLRTCAREFCLFRFEEVGLGTPVLLEVQKSPELIDFELSLALVAAYSTRDVFEPFPAFLLEKEQIRGRSGWFSKVERVEYSATSAQAASRLVSYKKTLNSSSVAEGANFFSENKNINLLREILQSYPSSHVMEGCPDEVTLKKTLSNSWQKKLEAEKQKLRGKRPDDSDGISEWTKKLWLPYDVLRFILSTNRLTLYPLHGDDRLDFKDARYQFAVLHDSPEREAHFEGRRNEQGGSFFAFHGSPADNWFSILRNGLRCLSHTAYMSTGASYGSGLYLASHSGTSLGYSHFKGPAWSHGCFKDGLAVLAICEVINGSLLTNSVSFPHSSASASSNSAFAPYVGMQGIMVVPPQHEKDVAIRYIIVFGQHPAGSHYINGTSLSNGVDLMTHSRNLRSMYPLRQKDLQRTRQEVRWQALEALRQKKRESEEDLIFKESQAKAIHVPPVDLPRKTEPQAGHSLAPVRNGMVSVNRVAPLASAMQAISKEYKNIIRQINAAAKRNLQTSDDEDLPILAGIEISLPDETDLCRWHVSLSQGLFKRWPLYRDLADCARHWKVPEVPVKLEFLFPATYPFAPPFARVVSPVFSFHTGHVTVGGSICMELLTESGWSPACSFESVIVQIVNAIIEGAGRLDKAAWISHREYSEREAREAFDRVARAHGWIKEN